MSDLVFAGADEISLRSNTNEQLASTTDPDRIANVLTALDGLADGWDVPAGGVPIAKLRLEFRQDGELLGTVGVGKKFLSAHLGGTFRSRPGDEDIARTLLRAAGGGHLFGRL